MGLCYYDFALKWDWRLSGKNGEKRPILNENMDTNTGLNMQNEPAVGCRLSVNHFHSLSMYIAHVNRNKKKVALLTLLRVHSTREGDRFNTVN